MHIRTFDVTIIVQECSWCISGYFQFDDNICIQEYTILYTL